MIADGSGQGGFTVAAYLEVKPGTELNGVDQLNAPMAATTTTDKKGRFSLRLDRNAIPDQFIDEDNAVNFLIQVTDGNDLIASHSATVYAPALDKRGKRRGPWTAINVEGERAKAKAIRLNIELDDSPIGFDVLEEHVSEEAFENDLVVPNQGIDEFEELAIENQAWYCSQTRLNKVKDAPVIMNTAGTNSPYITYDYLFNQFGSSADSVTVGVGFSYSGLNGSWTQTGTTKVSSSVTLEFPQRTKGHRHYKSKISYYRWQYSCTGATGTNTHYIIKPENLRGDAWSTWTASKGCKNCTIVGPNVVVRHKTGTTVSYSNGVSLSGGIGSGAAEIGNLSLSSINKMEGGDSHQLSFRNTHPTARKYVCGQHGPLGSNNTGRLVGDWQNRDWQR